MTYQYGSVSFETQSETPVVGRRWQDPGADEEEPEEQEEEDRLIPKQSSSSRSSSFCCGGRSDPLQSTAAGAVLRKNHPIWVTFVAVVGAVTISTIVVMTSFSSSSSSSIPSLMSLLDHGSPLNEIHWNDATVDEWNQFLYHHSRSLKLDSQAADNTVEEPQDLSTTSINLENNNDDDHQTRRTLKSEAKKLEHAEKKLTKKQTKMAIKATTDDSGDDGFGDTLRYLNSSETFRMIRHSGNDKLLSSTDDFFHYQNGWEAQINQAYCAVATSAAALNSLRGFIELPQDPVYVPFPWATQLDLIGNECVGEAVHDPGIVKYVGLGLGMVPGLLNCFLESQGFVATGHPIDPTTSTVDDVRDLVKTALMESDSRVLLNYDRGGIGQGDMGHGHWSPIGAYHAVTDSFLIMDVAKYKFPPVFVSSERLFHGASTTDTCSSMGVHPTPVDLSSRNFTKILHDIACSPGYRGFVIIRRK